MNKIKSWFKSVFRRPEDDDVRFEMARVLDICDIIHTDKPDMKKMCDLLEQVTLHSINFVWHDALLTPMELACSLGHPGCIVALIAKGADVNGGERNKHSLCRRPIHFACLARNEPRAAHCVRLLVERGADCNAADVNGDTPIQQAAFCGNVEAVEYLLQRGVDVNSQGPAQKGSPLVWACLTPALKEFAQQGLIRSTAAGVGDSAATAEAGGGAAPVPGASVRSPSDHWPSQARLLQLMRLLLDHGADVSRVMESSYDCLTLTAMNLYVERTLLLLAYGADPNNATHPPEYRCILQSVLQRVAGDAAKRDDFLVLLALLLEAGASLSPQSLERDLRPVLEGRVELAPVKGAVGDMLEHYAASPPMLKSLCRRQIRACLPSNIDATLSHFPVTAVLRRYLRFEDIAPREQHDV